MKEINFKIIIIMLFCTASNVLFAQRPGEPWMETLNQEFQNCEVHSTPIGAWEAAGSNAVIYSVFTINVTAFPDSVTYEDPDTGDLVPIPHAQSGDGFDNSFTFSKLITWINTNVDSLLVHTQIYIPSGVYNFSDQIVMHSNISLKGAGSDQTELRFLIKSDSIMTQADCRKDAIQIDGSSFTLEDRISYAAVCLLKGEL